MNKTELISEVAGKLGVTKKDTSAAIDAIVTVITDALADGQEINIAGFGKFSVSERAAREGRNPATGETISIPASKAPKFKVAKALKDAVNA